MHAFRLALLLGALVLAVPPCSFAGDAMIIPVDSPAFAFSPGNWTGDAGRGGSSFRQTWYPYAYFRVAWESTGGNEPTARLLLDTSTYADPATGKPLFGKPLIAYCIDGVWKSRIACTAEIAIEPIAKTPGRHELSVFFHWSEEKERWGSTGRSGLNILRVTGLQVNAGAVPVPAVTRAKWALIIGDSITAGCGASELAPYSYLVGQALQTQGYEFGLSACGWSGWLNKGDNPPGDVPGYYVIANATDGVGGEYRDELSRWNKIDGNGHSLLDAQGHISAHGQTGQEPSLILINYGTNDILHGSKPSDTRASIRQALEALRTSAPQASIVLIIPFGQYYAKEIRNAAESFRKDHPQDQQIRVIDLGPEVARNLAEKNGVMGGLHPNDRGHAVFAAHIIPQVMAALDRR